MDFHSIWGFIINIKKNRYNSTKVELDISFLSTKIV